MYCPVCQSDYPPDWKACPKDAAALLKSALIGKYRIEGMLGVGGMGAVYRATNPDIRGSRVAIKVMNPSVAGAEATRERFKREAAAVAALRTAHVVKVYDFNADADGALYLVMELLDGHPLRDEILPAPQYMDLARVQMVMDGALRGLAAAHRAGIVHRDLKPENIFIADTDDGEVPKLLDFGIARVKSTDKNLTHTGSLMGTASYMAIEQIAANAGEIGPWTDVYAMGAILYEMLAGAPAFGGNTITEVLQRVLQAERVPLASIRGDLPPETYAVVDRCMSSEPAKRPQDAEGMRVALRTAALVPPGAPVPPPHKTKPDAAPNVKSDVAILPTEGRDTPIPQLTPPKGTYDQREQILGQSTKSTPSTPLPIVESQPPRAAGTGPGKSVAVGTSSGQRPVGENTSGPTKKRAMWPFALVGVAVLGLGGFFVVRAVGGDDKPGVVATADGWTSGIGGGHEPDAGVRADSAIVVSIDAADDKPPKVTEGMVRIAAGDYEIGEANAGSPAALKLKKVTLPEFWIDPSELTLGELRAALKDPKAGGEPGDAAELPARDVSWAQAAAACQALGKRLPTEAEWEVAARTTPRDPKQASLCTACPAGKPALVAPTKRDCSPDGLCDMLGSLLEWTADGANNKLVRGASFTVSPAAGWQASIHFRAEVPPAADVEVGFRCVFTEAKKPPPDPKPACNTDQEEDDANAAMQSGQFTVALAKLETALVCKPDAAALRMLAVMAACNVKNEDKAKTHFAKLTSKGHQARVREVCIRQGINL